MSINQGTFDHRKLADPRLVGPGAWKTLHLLAVWDDLNGQNTYPSFIRFYCKRFKCQECGGHCTKFLDKYPPERRKGDQWGMSRHSFELHNAANKSLGKPQLTWEEFTELFIKEGQGVCQEGCGKAKKISEERLASVNFDNIKKLSYDDPSLVMDRSDPRIQYRRKK